MKKQLLCTVLLMQIMQAESPADSTFMDGFERSMLRSNVDIEKNYKKLSEADRNKLRDIVNQWMCRHFAERGFSSFEDAMKDEKYSHYKCPNLELCEEIFKLRDELIQEPSEKFKRLAELTDSDTLQIQEKYKFSKDQMVGLVEYIKHFIVLDQR